MRRILALTTTVAAALSAAVPAAATQSSGAPVEIVQMGDSYSSGNGARTYAEKTCWRSPDSYGAQVARATGAQYRNVACSGGVTRDILNPRVLSSKKLVKTYRIPWRQHSDQGAEWLRRAKADQLCGTPAQPDWYYRYERSSPSSAGNLYTATLTCSLTARAQIAAVNPSTDQVFITIGGNDIDFTEIATQCLALKASAGCKRAIDAANAAVPRMRAETERVLAAVHRRSAGNATVYLLGYPYLISRESFGLPEAAPRYDAGKALNALQVRGDRQQAAAIEGLNASTGTRDFVFVDVKPAWGGHAHGYDPRTGASNRTSWITPVLAPGTEYKEWVHPRPAGWAASAVALRGALR